MGFHVGGVGPRDVIWLAERPPLAGKGTGPRLGVRPRLHTTLYLIS
jgi:hypothetical protein